MKNNNKNMKKLGVLLVGIFLITIMIGGVFGEGREFGNGVYKNVAGGLSNQPDCDAPGTQCTKATGAEMLNKDSQAIDLQGSMDKGQAEEYNKLKLDKWNVEIEGDQGTHSEIEFSKEGEEFTYRGKKFSKSQIESAKIKKMEFNGDDIKIKYTTDPNKFNFNVESGELTKITDFPVKQEGCGPLGCNAGGFGNGGAQTAGNPADPLNQNSPFSAPSFQQGGGFGGGIGGGAGGGSPTPQLDQAAQIGIQMAGSVAGLIPKKENQAPAEEDPSSFGNGPGFAETYLASLSGGEVNVAEGEVTIDNGAIVAFQSEGEQTLIGGQTVLSSPATIKEGGQNSIVANNLAFVRPNEIAAETTDSTTIDLSGISGNDPSNPASSTSNIGSLKPSFLTKIKELFPLSTLVNGKSITGKVIGTTGQSIQLTEHDLNVDGHDMNIYSLKTFNNIEFGGNNLHLYNGDLHLKFNGQRIMYSRLITNAPYGIKRVSNKLDINQNKYTLQHFDDKLGQLYDENYIITVGDITSTVGNGPYARLLINRDRLEMFRN